MSYFKSLKVPEESNKKESLWSQFSTWWYKKTRYTWWRKMMNNISDFKTGIKNIFKWLPIVWYDRDWHDEYILKVLKFKIKNTRDCIINANRAMDVAVINKYCTISLKLIDAIMEETYAIEYLDYFESEYNWFPTGNTIINEKGKKENLLQLDIKDISSFPHVYFKKYPRIHKLVIDEISKEEPDRAFDEKYVAIRIAGYNHDRAKNLLFKILSENLQKWWY